MTMSAQLEEEIGRFASDSSLMREYAHVMNFCIIIIIKKVESYEEENGTRV